MLRTKPKVLQGCVWGERHKVDMRRLVEQNANIDRTFWFSSCPLTKENVLQKGRELVITRVTLAYQVQIRHEAVFCYF